MKSVDDLWNRITYIMAYAPNFPHRDFLPDDHQMTLDSAFDSLRQGVQIAYPEPSFETKRALLNGILDRSYNAYRSGDEDTACHLLNEFEDNIFKRK